MLSLHLNNRGLYVCDEKKRVIEELMENHLQSLDSVDRFHGEEASEVLEAPTVYLWCLYYLAQHYDYNGKICRVSSINIAVRTYTHLSLQRAIHYC